MTKTLIIYYSTTGGTASVAKLLAEKTQADTVEIKTVKPYDENMWTAWDVAQLERETNQLPELAIEIPDLLSYDRIFIGTPTWGHTMSNPIMSLLQEVDFQGKPIYGFWTFYDHDEQMISYFKKNIQNGNFIKGLPVTQSYLHDRGRLDSLVSEFAASID